MKKRMLSMVLLVLILLTNTPISGFASTYVRYHVTNIMYVNPTSIRIDGYFFNSGTTEVYNIHDVYFLVMNRNVRVVEGTAPPSKLIYETLRPGDSIHSAYLLENCKPDQDLFNAQISKAFNYDVSKEHAFNQGMKMFFNNAPLSIQGPQPYTVGKEVMVPARAFAELFGSKIKWVSNENRIIITKNNSSISMKIGEREATFDGKSVDINIAPVLIDGCAYIPLYAVGCISFVPYEYNREDEILTMTQI